MALTIAGKPLLENIPWLRPKKLELDLCPEPYFLHELMQERRRAQRGNRPLVVMLVDALSVGADKSEEVAQALCQCVKAAVRDTDICGLLQKHMAIAVIFTVVETEKIELAKQKVPAKIREKLREMAGDEVAQRLKVTFHIFPPSATERQVRDPYLHKGGNQAAGAGEGSARSEGVGLDAEELGLRRLARFLQECSKKGAKAGL